MSYTHAIKGNWGTAVKTSAGHKDHPLKNMEDRGIFDSGCSGHMTGNKDHLDDFEECKGGSVTFGGSKGYITGKGRIRLKVLFTETECLLVSPRLLRCPDEIQLLLKETKMALTKDEEADEVDVTPKTSHLNAVKRIFKYLKGKPNLGLWYPRESSFDLEAYSDSDYAGANLDRKSTTGGCQFLGSRLISWQYTKQTINWCLATELPHNLADGTLELRATIDTLEYTITEASVRSKLQLADASRISMLPNTEIFEGMGNMGYPADGVFEGYLDLLPAMLPVVAVVLVQDKQNQAVTKLTMGKALVKLVKKVKNMEDVLKRRHVVLPDSEDEDAKISSKQGRKWEEDIQVPTPWEAAKTLSMVASQRSKSVDKGKRYKRRKESKGKDIDIGFEDISTRFEDISTSFEYISTGFEEVNIGSLGVSTGSRPVSSARGQREGKAPMIVEADQASPKRIKIKFNKKKLVLQKP
ncbi:hypothetical protein Tco_1104540 [Tanacetum coccineum]